MRQKFELAAEMRRFNILVLNYKRLPSFLENFDKIKGFDSLQDRITIFNLFPLRAGDATSESFFRKVRGRS